MMQMLSVFVLGNYEAKNKQKMKSTHFSKLEAEGKQKYNSLKPTTVNRNHARQGKWPTATTN